MFKNQDSEVSRFYQGRSIFITGATGFLGKVLLEKLLQSCPEIRNIYILMREKKGKSAVIRCKDLMKSEIFELVKSEQAEAFEKVIVVTGDLCLPLCGVSEDNIATMSKNVSIVFHSAAAVRFQEPLKKAVDMNMLGTRRILELCRKLQKIEALIHVSTANCNCNRREVEEVIYPTHVSPQHIIELTRWLDPAPLETITAKICDRPNTYTFTKALAESILAEESGTLPVAIIRPSIVSAAWKEPFPGWIDTLNGPTGTILAFAKGMLRTFTAHEELVADIIPVDVVVNLMITVAWHIAIHRSNRMMVYHCASGVLNRTTWADIRRFSTQYCLKHPSAEVFRYPDITFRRTRLRNKIHVAFEHYLIAFIIDIVTYIFHRKLRMVRQYQQIHRAVDSVQYFTTHECKFHCGNILMLSNLLSEEDKQKFFIDIRSLNWETFWENHALGLRKFLLKEDPSTLPAARKNLKMRYILSQVVQVVVAICVFIFVFSKVS